MAVRSVRTKRRRSPWAPTDMPNEIKAVLSVIAMIVAVALAYWQESIGNAHLFWFVIGTAIFMVASMWMFPEAVGKKKKRG